MCERWRRSGRRAGQLAAASFLANVHALLLLSSASVAADGKAVFETNCSACHQHNGEGAPGLAPPLTSKHVAAAGQRPEYIGLVVLNGLSGVLPLDDGSTISGIMPPVGQGLSDAEVASVIGYVLETFNGAKVALAETTVSELRSRKPTAKELRAMRQELIK